MNYDELTDFEINKMIADSQGVNYKIETVFRNPVPDNKDGYKCLMKKLGPKYRELDYCNNWNHAGPLIEKYNISIKYRSKVNNWWAECTSDFTGKDKKPLRAAMVALLRSQEKENE